MSGARIRSIPVQCFGCRRVWKVSGREQLVQGDYSDGEYVGGRGGRP